MTAAGATAAGGLSPAGAGARRCSAEGGGELHPAVPPGVQVEGGLQLLLQRGGVCPENWTPCAGGRCTPSCCAASQSRTRSWCQACTSATLLLGRGESGVLP